LLNYNQNLMLFKFAGDTRKRLLRYTVVCEVTDDAVDSVNLKST
jgi:hypothetical protein